MAAIAEETDQERRQREGEEALAEIEYLKQLRVGEPAPAIQDALPAPEIPFTPPESRLPQDAIPAENASFTNDANSGIQIDTPAGFAPAFDRPQIGDQQYQNEVARARAGSGFIQGYGDTPTHDPAIAEAAQRQAQDKLAAQAKRFSAIQGYQQAIKNGNTHAEALALFGKDMYPGAPTELAALVTRREPLPRVAKAAPLPKAIPGIIPPEIKLQQSQLEKRIAADRAELNRGVKEEEDAKGKLVRKAMTPREKLALSRRIEADELAARELIAPGGRLREEFNPRIDQSGFNRERWDVADSPRPSVQAAPAQAAAPAKAEAAPAVNEAVRLTKDGKRAVYDAETKKFIRYE